MTKKEDSQNSNSNLYSASLKPKIPPDNEIVGSIGSINEKHRMVLNADHNWFKIFIKSFSTKRVLLLIQFQGFCSGSAGTLKVNQSVHIA